MIAAPTDRPSTPSDGCRRWSLRLPGGRALDLVAGRPRILAIVNITPDSFSDGGLWLDPERAVAHALALIEQGADALDLGAESTRPGGGVYGAGAAEVSPEEELRRLLPVLERLRRVTDLPLSVDTRKAAVARAALAAGADLINDVSALGDPTMAPLLAAAGCPAILMHSRGPLPTMQREIRFADVVVEVRQELAQARDRAVGAGIDLGQLLLDPGIGFGKSADQSVRLIARLGDLAELGCPLVLGASRKSFLAHLCPAPAGRERLPGSLAAVAVAAAQGAALVRVHDVAETRQFLQVWQGLAPEATAR